MKVMTRRSNLKWRRHTFLRCGVEAVTCSYDNLTFTVIFKLRWLFWEHYIASHTNSTTADAAATGDDDNDDADAYADVRAVPRTAPESCSKRRDVFVCEGIRRRRTERRVSPAVSGRSKPDLWRRGRCHLLAYISRYWRMTILNRMSPVFVLWSPALTWAPTGFFQGWAN